MENLQTKGENRAKARGNVKINVFFVFLMGLISMFSFYITLSGTLSQTNGLLTFVLSVIFPASYGIWGYCAKTNLQKVKHLLQKIRLPARRNNTGCGFFHGPYILWKIRCRQTKEGRQ